MKIAEFNGVQFNDDFIFDIEKEIDTSNYTVINNTEEYNIPSN